jgi:prepilin-type N-terminal cleavage/methylation domain-containing protein
MSSLVSTALSNLGRLMIGLVMLFLFLAGVSKSLDLVAFSNAVQGFSLIPDWAQRLSPLIPALEILIGGSWLFQIVRWRAVWGAGAMLMAFSLLLVAHMAVGKAPECGCLGKFFAFQSLLQSAQMSLVRNGILLGLLVCGTILVRSAPSASGPANSDARGSSSLGDRDRSLVNGQADPSDARARGFSILEMVVSIAIVALLIVLLAPSLTRIRTSAMRASDIAALRSHAAIFALYAGDFQDQWPCFTDPKATYSVLRNQRYDLTIEAYHFLSYLLWSFALSDAYFDGEFRSKQFAPSVLHTPNFGGNFAIGFQYSCTFVASPEHWNPSSRVAGTALLGSTRVDQVVFPSAKVLLLDPAYEFNESTQWARPFGFRADRHYRPGVATSDGAATMVNPDVFQPAYASGDGVTSSDQGHMTATPKPLHTLGGVRGRDLP